MYRKTYAITTDKEKTMTSCTQCTREIDRLAVFPAGLCVDCYAQTEEANRPITARELAQMWGGK